MQASLLLYARVINRSYYGKEMTIMSAIKNFIVGLFVNMIMAAAAVIGMLAGAAMWENGLGDKVAAKAKKLFNKK
jgi:hypothetical protein